MDNRRYDSTLNANISICKKKDYYEIIFSHTGDITVYQVWSEESPLLNNQRIILTYNAEEWVTTFEIIERTCLMETTKCKYAFVIKNIELRNGKMIWKVSTKEIIDKSKNVSKKLPTGNLKKVRIDVDAIVVGTQTGQKLVGN